VTYPSGRVVTNTRDSQLGKIASVSTSGFGDLVSGLTYNPFGGPKGLTNGFGGTVNNQAGECDCVTVSNPGQPRERTYGYDANRNLTSITGTTTPSYSQTFGYDELNRLSSASGRYGTIGYTYDDVGNRLTRNTNGVTESYTYYAGTNSLYQITGGQDPRTFSYDANGNPTSDGALTFIYDQNNQLKEVKNGANTIATYTYNGLGQRVKKVAGEITTIYHYDLDGKLNAESTSTGTFTKEYLHMGKVRVAMVDIGPGGSSIYHYLNDRFGTPEILTDASGVVRWEAWYAPFGEAHVHPSSSVVNNIRLPGQYFDQETGLHYNYHRYYDPRTGRYITPDPIGLVGGINPFAYVQGDPVNVIDPEGLVGPAALVAPAVFIGVPILIAAAYYATLPPSQQSFIANKIEQLWDSPFGEIDNNVCEMREKAPRWDPRDLGPLKGAPSLPFPGANIGSPDPNLPPPPNPNPKPKTVWEKIKFMVKEGIKRLPYILNPPT
jgi:RHS repeat-associated protein